MQSMQSSHGIAKQDDQKRKHRHSKGFRTKQANNKEIFRGCRSEEHFSLNIDLQALKTSLVS